MSNITLIIPTHNRHRYLKRSIAYFKNLQADVIYCDSSSEKYEGELFPNVSYLHLPDQNFGAKILFALSTIKTNFVALCADDDFLIIESIYKGLSFLNENKQFKTIVGKYISFKDAFDGNYYKIYGELPSDIDLDFSKNTEIFFKNYYQILWGMYDKEILIKAFQIITKAKFHNDNFIELVIGVCACNSGSIKFLDEIWGVREISTKEHWGNRHAPITSMQIAQINGDYKRFQELVDSVTFRGCSSIAINSYISGQAMINKVSFRTLISRFIPEFIKEKIRNISSVQNSNAPINLDKKHNVFLHSITNVLNEYSFNN